MSRKPKKPRERRFRNAASLSERRAREKVRKQEKVRTELEGADEVVFRYIMHGFETFAPEGQSIDGASIVRLGFLERRRQNEGSVYRIRPVVNEQAD